MAKKNDTLRQANKSKSDEFYTQYEDIQREVNAYLEYDSDTFRGKTVLLPCDDPEWSNFTRFFAQNFEMLGLKKLISTSYSADSKRQYHRQRRRLSGRIGFLSDKALQYRGTAGKAPSGPAENRGTEEKQRGGIFCFSKWRSYYRLCRGNSGGRWKAGSSDANGVQADLPAYEKRRPRFDAQLYSERAMGSCL